MHKIHFEEQIRSWTLLIGSILRIYVRYPPGLSADLARGLCPVGRALPLPEDVMLSVETHRCRQ
jgi:hypothetical protein